MKDSGIEWIGEIPKDWKIIKCKYTANLYTGNSIKDEEKANYEDSTNAIPYIATKDIDVTFSTVDNENGLYINNDDLSFSRANAGDTLMCIEGGSAGRKKALVDRKVCFVNKLCCFHPLTIEASFLYYILNSPHYEEEFRFNISGLIGGVSKNKLLNFVFPFPSLFEQQKLSTYLDTKCTKIDSIIENQEKVIEKLKAYKMSVITEEVTKGLNPDVKMKDSGVEWIGDIPEHWEITKFKYLSLVIGDGIHTTPEYDSAGSIYFINGNNIGFDNLVFKDNTNAINEEEYEKYKLPLLTTDTILITLNGATYGKTSFYNDEKVLLGKSAGFITLKPNENKRFVRYYLQCNAAKLIMEISLLGSTIANLSLNTLKNFSMPYPTREEQQQIAEYLDKKCSAIDSAIEKKQAIIEKLKEYKKSLIYEVVTGKRKV